MSSSGLPVFSIQELRGEVSVFSPTMFNFEVDSPLSCDLYQTQILHHRLAGIGIRFKQTLVFQILGFLFV